MWAILKSFIGFVTILLLFYALVPWLWGMWDLSFLTRDGTCTPWIGRQSPTAGWPRNSTTCILNSCLPRNLPYSEVPGTRAQTPFRGPVPYNSPFKVYNSMVFYYIHRIPGDHHHFNFWTFFITPKRQTKPINSHPISS